jgi:chromosome segregation ATPase
MNTKKSKVKNFLQSTLVEVSKALKGLKFNPNHDSSSGRFSTGSGSGARLSPDTGGGTGGGLGGSPGGKESYSDKIEGTQKEADREVKRADKKVSEVRKALNEAKERLDIHNETVEIAKKKAVAVLQSRIDVVSEKISMLRKEKAAGDIRMAELKKKLAVFKERDKERAARRAARRAGKSYDEWKDLQAELEEGISLLKKIIKSAVSIYNESDDIAEKAAKL